MSTLAQNIRWAKMSCRMCMLDLTIQFKVRFKDQTKAKNLKIVRIQLSKNENTKSLQT